MVDPVTIVISSLISSIVGGLTVAIYTNARADAREDKKLQHDAEQKDRDRLLSIKKDIYYSVVGDFARFQLALATLADTSLLTLQTALPSADFAANYAKIELIAPLPLVREVQKVSQEVRETFMPLMLERARLQLKADSLNEAGMMLHEAVVAWDAHNRLHSEFRVRCMEGSLRIRRLLAPAVREIRRELDVSVDMKKFEVLLQTDIDHADRAFRRFQAALLGSTLSN